MSRNQNSRFALNPTNIDISRSRFTRNSSVKTSFNVGDIVPFYVDEVLPGDSFDVSTNKVVRMQPLVSAPMDNLYLDTYYFFVPNRLVWEHWRNLMGENTDSAWIPTTEYEVPQITSPASTGWTEGTIADYFGIPTNIPNLSVNALPFRAYALIMNEWFRDENLTDPLNIPVDETTVAGVNTGTYVTDVAKGGLPFVASKYHDYFTSCLPSPQKGPDVVISATDSIGKVFTGDSHDNNGSVVNMHYGLYNSTSNSITYSNAQRAFPAVKASGSDNLVVPSNSVADASSYDMVVSYNSSQVGDALNIYPDNLYASLGATATTINQLRMAFQIQKLYEKDARGGTRYIESIKSHFGVTSPDARLQRPEYLGGNRVPININQVIQTSNSGTDITPQGNVAGYSLSNDSNNDFFRSFTEHGFIIGVMVARYDHTYQQGLERFWSRKTRFDYYYPVLANIGEQAILNKEIYAQGTGVTNPDTNAAVDDEVFGYQEAWADYRYKPSRVTGEMRSNLSKSLDSWHFADDYDELPRLSDSWIREDKSPVDRVLAVQSSVSNQLFADIYIQNTTTRPMPMYSIPGLIDHH
ncbi:major CP [Chimpanzee faeces associated microphage 2]|uniref:major CP n=1 Tax=Chimpanzee faeces associated microphage 2 TaxID=1676182 RepID=UPI0007FB6782|nr:major CP [Chimpanzee faeces associated microphage 2]AKO71495.1 major CP [Chimpanzee faeces associated microphage 2]